MSQDQKDANEHFPIPCTQDSTFDQQNSFKDEFEELQQQPSHGAAETAQLQQQESARDAEIAQLQVQVRNRDVKIAQLQQDVKNRDVDIAQLQYQLISQHDKIAQVKYQLNTGHDRIAQAKAHISASQRSLQVSDRILGDGLYQGREVGPGRCRSHFGGQEGCGPRLPLTNCMPNLSVSDARLVMMDSSDFGEQAVGSVLVNQGGNGHSSTCLPLPFPQSPPSAAAAEAQESLVNNHAYVSPPSTSLTFDTMPDKHKIDLLFQILSKLKQENTDISQRLENTIKEKYQHLDEMQMLERKVAFLQAETGNLRTKINVPLSDKQTPAVLRAGAKRGRFVLSKAQVVECSYCHYVFSSFEDACNSICDRHTKPATELPNKMVNKMHETNSKVRYWPCCKQLGTHIPPPCFHGTHKLRYL